MNKKLAREIFEALLQHLAGGIPQVQTSQQEDDALDTIRRVLDRNSAALDGLLAASVSAAANLELCAGHSGLTAAAARKLDQDACLLRDAIRKFTEPQ